MLICSTILYFQDNPVGYDLLKNENGFVLHPTPTTKSNLIPPTITVAPLQEGWQIEGVSAPDVQQQVTKLIELHEVIGVPGKLGAAS